MIVKTICTYALVCVSLAVLFMSCVNSGDVLAGGTTDSGNSRMAGRIVSAGNLPVVGATVTLHDARMDLVADTVVDSTISDNDGRYEFTQVVPGTYQIVVISPDSQLIAFISNISVVSGADTSLTSTSAVSRSSLEGTIAFPVDDSSVSLTAWIVGTPFSTSVSPDGSFKFASLPPGQHVCAVVLTGTNGKTLLGGEDSVVVSEGTHITGVSINRYSLGNVEDTLLIDNFDDGNPINALGGYWWVFDDEGRNGVSTPSVASAKWDYTPDADSNGFCAHAHFTFDTWRYSLAGIGTNLLPSVNGFNRGVDLSNLYSIRFYARGTGHTADLTFFSPVAGYMPIKKMNFQSDWNIYEVIIDSAVAASGAGVQENWSRHRSDITILQWTVGHGDNGVDGHVWIDDISFIFK